MSSYRRIKHDNSEKSDSAPWDWEDLELASQSCEHGFKRDRIQSPTPSDSRQCWADRYTALLAGPWPAEVKCFFKKYRRPLERLASEVGMLPEIHGSYRSSSWRLSLYSELGNELCLIAVRNGQSWHDQWNHNGRSENERWIAYILGKHGRSLKTLLKRRSHTAARRVFSCYRSGQSWIETVADPHYDRQHAITRARRIQGVRAAVKKLSPHYQRCLRLRFGMFPARSAWDVEKIARFTGLSPDGVLCILGDAFAMLKDRLTSVPRSTRPRERNQLRSNSKNDAELRMLELWATEA